MNAGVEHLQAVLARAAQAETEVNLHELLGRMTMEVVGTTAFGRALPRAREPVHVAMIHSKRPCGAHVQQVSRALTCKSTIETWGRQQVQEDHFARNACAIAAIAKVCTHQAGRMFPGLVIIAHCVTDRSSRAGCRIQEGQQCDHVHALMVRRCGGQG